MNEKVFEQFTQHRCHTINQTSWFIVRHLCCVNCSKPFSFDDSFNVRYHCLFIWPMVRTMGDVSIMWEGDSRKTPNGLTLVDKLWRKEVSSKWCGKDSCYLLFIVHPYNLHSWQSFLIHGPWPHWWMPVWHVSAFITEIRINNVHWCGPYVHTDQVTRLK